MDESNHMGGGNTPNNQPSQGSDQKVFFDSYNIGRKEKAQYFPGEEGAQKEAKGIAKLFEGKNKFITIAVIAVVVILLIIFILWLTLWRSSGSSNVASEPDGSTTGIPETSVRLGQIGDAAMAIYENNIDAENPYSYVENYLYNEGEKEENSDIRFSIYMLMSSIYLTNKDYEKDIEYLLNFDLPNMDRANAARVCKDLSIAYASIGDSEQAGYYSEQQIYYSGLADGEEGEENA